MCIYNSAVQVETHTHTHTFNNLPHAIKQTHTSNLLGCRIMCGLKEVTLIRVRDRREKQGASGWVRWGLLSGEGFTK